MKPYPFTYGAFGLSLALAVTACQGEDLDFDIKINELYEPHGAPLLVAGVQLGEPNDPNDPVGSYDPANDVHLATLSDTSESAEILKRDFSFSNSLHVTFDVDSSTGTRPRLQHHEAEISCGALVAASLLGALTGIESFIVEQNIRHIEVIQDLYAFGGYDHYLGSSDISLTIVNGRSSLPPTEAKDGENSLRISVHYGRDVKCPSEERILEEILKLADEPENRDFSAYPLTGSAKEDLATYGYEISRLIRRFHVRNQ